MRQNAGNNSNLYGFIFHFFKPQLYPQQEYFVTWQNCAARNWRTPVRLFAAVRTFAPGSIPVGIPNRNRTCIKGLGNPRSIQLNYGDSALYFIHIFLILQVVITACIIRRIK